MSDVTLLGGGQPEYVLGHVIQALSEDPRTTEMDVQVRVADRRVVLDGCVTTEDHRSQMERVVAELVPDWEIVNRLEVRHWKRPETAEAI